MQHGADRRRLKVGEARQRRLLQGHRVWLWLGCLVWLCSAVPVAQAGGMFVSPHGARPLGRGGAFVAGADDLNAIYYNPAGVALATTTGDAWLGAGKSGFSVLFDLGFVLQNIEYTRNENGILRPTITGDAGLMGGAPLSIPQLAIAKRLAPYSWGSLTLGLGLWIPYTGLMRYPEPSYATEEDLRRVPEVAPQRYALLGLHEGSLTRSTVLAVLNPVASFSLLKDRLQLGIGPQLMIVYFRSRLMLNGCPQVMCRPEQPDYDTLVVAQAFAVTPAFNLGALYRVLPWLRLGAAFQFPFLVRSAKGTVDTLLGTNEIFNGATVQGRDASLSLNLPPILRIGAEFAPLADRLRIELAYTVEFWSVQDEVRFTPNGITIENLKGIGSYPLGPVALRRDMLTTHAIHLGGEAKLWKYLGARLGGMFESSGMPDSTLTVLTPDGHKGLVALSLFVPKVHFLSADWRIDVSYGHIFQGDRVVDPAASQIYPANPLRPEATYPPGVGGTAAGTYAVRYDLIALGFAVTR
ncbi:MAG: outer membrane protein transport protein [Myxococcales bacterium]|nr:outer membrane protein transport protein [Myxococcales bacterium]